MFDLPLLITVFIKLHNLSIKKTKKRKKRREPLTFCICTYTNHPKKALPLRLCPRRNNRRHSRTHYIPRPLLGRRLHLDRGRLPPRQRSLRPHLGVALRHLGPQAHHARCARTLLRQLRRVRFCKDDAGTYYWAGFPGRCGWRVDIACARVY